MNETMHLQTMHDFKDAAFRVTTTFPGLMEDCRGLETVLNNGLFVLLRRKPVDR